MIASLKRSEGTAGLLAIDRLHPERMVAARIGSPVIVGIGDGAGSPPTRSRCDLTPIVWWCSTTARSPI